MYTFKFQPTSGTEEDIMTWLKVSKSPIIEYAQEVVIETSLGDGTTLYRHTGVYKEVKIKIECNFIAPSRETFIAHQTKLEKYFGDKQGLLELSEDRDHYWKAVNVDIQAGERSLKRASLVTITFTCEPYRYFKEYSKPQSFVSGQKTIFNNPYAPATPVYKIYNDSENATRLWIMNNGKQLEIFTPFSPEGGKAVSYIEINTQWNYLKAVFNDSSYEYRTIDTKGSFADIRFGMGINEVEVGIDIGAVRVEVERGYKER